MHNKITEFQNALKRMADSSDGKVVMQHLVDSYLIPSCLDKDVHKTFYNLGQSDLVSQLMSIINKKQGLPVE